MMLALNRLWFLKASEWQGQQALIDGYCLRNETPWSKSKLGRKWFIRFIINSILLFITKISQDRKQSKQVWKSIDMLEWEVFRDPQTQYGQSAGHTGRGELGKRAESHWVLFDFGNMDFILKEDWNCITMMTLILLLGREIRQHRAEWLEDRGSWRWPSHSRLLQWSKVEVMRFWAEAEMIWNDISQTIKGWSLGGWWGTLEKEMPSLRWRS